MLKRAVRQFGRFGWVRPTVLLLLTCHLGRFYSDIPVALAICFEHNHGGVMLTAAEDHHAHHHNSAVAHDHGQQAGPQPGSEQDHDTGFKIEHCRDVYQGITLNAPVVMSLPGDVVALIPDDSARVLASGAPLQFAEPSRAIFHPPQLLS